MFIVHVVVDEVDTVSAEKLNMQTLVFRKHLRKNEKVCKNVFACSYGAQVEPFKQKYGQKSCDTVHLSAAKGP